MGCNAFGEYPSKFNGGNLLTILYWWRITRLLIPTGEHGGEMFLQPEPAASILANAEIGWFWCHFNSIWALPERITGAMARVKAHFGHNGAVYSEYTGVPGGSGAGWGMDWRTLSEAGKGVPFGDPRIDGLGGYDTIVEKGVMANPSISYHWESQVEHAYMILEYHRFTGIDISRYMPFIKSSLIFFDEHYQLRQENEKREYFWWKRKACNISFNILWIIQGSKKSDRSYCRFECLHWKYSEPEWEIYIISGEELFCRIFRKNTWISVLEK